MEKKTAAAKNHYAVILCGGSGTRLWPLSRKNFPKPFLKLYSDRSLIQETFLRMAGAIPSENIFIVTDQENFFNVFNQLKEIYPGIREDRIIIEPTPRDTTPAIMLAVKYLAEKIGINETDPIIEVHSDHYIGKREAYLVLVKKALATLGDHIGLIGITPTKPDTGLGYIEKGKKEENYYSVSAFKEKPDAETAQKFLAAVKYVWNAGMYLFNIKTFTEELKKCDPEMHRYFCQSYDALVENFDQLPKIAIDYVLAERSKKVIMYEGDFDWSDIGSFDVLSEIAVKNDKVSTRHLAFDSNNVYANSVSDRLIVTVGVDDINVVENSDVIMVQKKGRSTEVKKAVEYLKEHQYREVEHNILVYRPWGKYEILIDQPGYRVKKFTVLPGAQLNLHVHSQRAEHWVVVKGVAHVFSQDHELELHEGESTYIKQGIKHKVENRKPDPLEIIEVQTGSLIAEEDTLSVGS